VLQIQPSHSKNSLAGKLKNIKFGLKETLRIIWTLKFIKAIFDDRTINLKISVEEEKMRPVPKDIMMVNCIDIEKISGRNISNRNASARTSCHAIFLFDGLDKERKKRIEKLIDYFFKDGMKITKIGCSSVGDSSEIEKKEVIFEALRKNKIRRDWKR
jgi:hypothetical protein